MAKKIKKAQQGTSVPVQDIIEMEKLRLAIQAERKQKRDSVRFSLRQQFPKATDNQKINLEMLEYYKTEPREYLLTDEAILSVPEERKAILLKKKKGGVIKDNMGQYNHPGKVTEIDSNRITMKGINYPVLGIDNLGNKTIMQPNGEYIFPGNKVTEYPIIDNMEKGKSGIHIKKSHKGLLHENLGVPKGEKIPASKLKIKSTDSPAVKKRKQFAINAKKWNKGQFGLSMEDIAPEGSTQVDLLNTQPGTTQWNTSGGGYSQFGMAPQQVNNAPSVLENIGEALPIAGNLFKGFGMLKQQKEKRQEARQAKNLSKLVRQVSELEPERVQRKYIRPEDTLLDPDAVGSSYGEGTNFLAKNGYTFKKAQFGAFLGNQQTGNQFGQQFESLGSWIGGGQGQASGESMIGSTLGSVAGSFLGPIGGKVGGAIGGAIGGIIGGGSARKLKKDVKATQNNLQRAALNQGVQSLQGQYSSFMENGGELAMGGQLKTHWGGYADSISENPYLPEGGESVLFKGKSHKDGGIGITFGKSPVEVEGGEPAVKLEDGGSLTVFGDMKIPSYGVSELNDPSAKGKKFKRYINDLNKVEAKQNKVVDKAIDLTEDNPINTPFDKLKISSADAMITGANMKLKDIAFKKQTASSIQNAILDTADELGLDSNKLSQGKIKKIKKGANLQQGGLIPNRGVAGPMYANIDPRTTEEMQKINTESNLAQALRFKNLITGANRNLVPSGDYANQVEGISTNQQIGGGMRAYTEIDPLALQKADSVINASRSALFGKKKTNTLASFQDGGTKRVNPRRGADASEYSAQRRAIPSPLSEEELDIQPIEEVQRDRQKYDWESDLATVTNLVLPYIRPSDQSGLDPSQLSGEMFALATNQLEPVQSQLYSPLLQGVSDISLQDQLNANQADFNAIQRQTGYNPAAQSALAAQKYAANSAVLGEQFRYNQAQKQATYNKNRDILNDATLKNLSILDTQYQRQAQAKSTTKATALTALNSISDKIAKNKLENRTLGIYENLYNYRYDNKGRAWNLNPLAEFNTQGEDLPIIDDSEVTQDVYKDKYGVVSKSRTRTKTKNKKSSNGSLVRYIKGY